MLCLLVVGRHIWSGSADKTIRVWDIQVLLSHLFVVNLPKSGRFIKDLRGHGGWVTTLLLSGTTVWSGSSDKNIRVSSTQ